VLFVLGWEPTRVWCAPCAFRRGRDIKGSAENHACDRCRAHDDGLRPCLVTFGSLVVSFGLCASCAELERRAVG